MNKEQALEFINERLQTMQYDGIGSKEVVEECIAFLKYAKEAIEKC